MLHIYPELSLMDSEIDISITNLCPGENVTIACKVIEKGYPYVSHAHYVASLSGEVHLKDDASFGGSYTGISQMGLFWSMCPAESERKNRRYIPTNVTKPASYDLQVFRGHLDKKEVDSNGEKSFAGGTALRCCCSSDVTRNEVKHGRVRGTIFKPTGKGPFKGVVDIYGGAGGIVESRAALLASHGFIAFTLPYFGYHDLISDIREVEVEYFIEALSYFQSLSYVLPGISLVGLSFGASLALYLSTVYSPISNVVFINGVHYLVQHIQQNGQEFPPLDKIPMDTSKIGRRDEYGAAFIDVIDYNENNCEEVVFKLEETSAAVQFLFVIGGDDTGANGKAAFDILYKRMKRFGKENQMQLLYYPGAGHFIDPPYMPQTLYGVYYPQFDIVGAVGGRLVENAAACMHSWKQMLVFLDKNTGCQKCKL